MTYYTAFAKIKQNLSKIHLLEFHDICTMAINWCADDALGENNLIVLQEGGKTNMGRFVGIKKKQKLNSRV